MLLFYLIKESFLYAINSLLVNKLRTSLTLLGVTIGIFAIISVFTIIGSLERSIRESIATLGDNVVYIQKWPWSFGGNYPWWDYMKRPVPNIEEAELILKRSQKAYASSYIVEFVSTVQYKENYAERINISAIQFEYQKMKDFQISKGRYFTAFEMGTGKNMVVLGYKLAKTLFPNQNPINKIVKIDGHKLVVIGVYAKEGEDMFGMSLDNTAHIPVNYAKTIYNLRSEYLDPYIMVEAKKNISADELIDELTGIMRAIRRLKPIEENDFALNKTSLITQGFQQIFKIIDLAGIIIGGFSILVGGFGIANIMFVSVKEQTKIIGIQKAIGAKRFFILFQFLFEAIMLSLIGGLLGLFLIFILTLIINSFSEMKFVMSVGNIIFGLSISVVVGIIAGILPALKASKLNPVDAINST